MAWRVTPRAVYRPRLLAIRRDYCGSLSPDQLFQAIEDGCIGPTDKNYKVFEGGGSDAGAGKFYFQHLSETEQRKFIAP